MITEIGVLRETGSRNVDMHITRYWGGEDVGPCIQLTAPMEDGGVGYIQLSAFDLLAIFPILQKYIIESGYLPRP